MSGASRALLVYLIVGMVLGSPWVEAAVWYVSATAGNNANAGTSAATAFKSLTHALTQPSLAPGDVIRVLPGTYDAANGETFPLPIKPGVSVVADTIVGATLPDGDPGAALRPRVLASGGLPAFKPDTTSNYDANTLIEGLLIRRDPADPIFADLINANPAPPRFNPTIRNNRLEAATGGGIYIEAATGSPEASPLIENNAFNSLGYGVFLYADSVPSITMNPVIQNNTFTTVANDIYLSGFSGFDGQMSPLITGNTSTGGQQFLTWSLAPGDSFDFAPTISSNSFTGDPTRSWGISGNVGIWQGAPRFTPLIENNAISAADGLIEMSANVWQFSEAPPITTPEWAPTIRGNTLTSSGSGIFLNTSISGGSPTAAPLIDNNVITSAYYGIYQSAWMEGAGNPVLAPSITGNTITTGGDGIIVSMSSQSLSPGSVGTYTPTVTGNGINITNGGYGIQMYFEDVYSGSIVADLTVSNNVLTSNGVCCGSGMSLSMSYFPTSGSANIGWTISNNSVSGFYYEGLFFEISELSGDTNGLEGTVDVLITGNTITNNGAGGMSLSISPYDFTGTQNILVQGNTITDNSGHGLVLSVSSQTDVTTNSIKVLDNVIDGNTDGGLYLWIEQWAPGGIPTNPTLVSGNTITNNAVGQPTTAYWGGVYVGEMPTPDFGGGNLASPGGNVISGNGPWDFINATSAIVKAESNDWGSTDPAAIDARIYDDNENALRGLVDFEPIANAVPPVTCPTAINAVAPTSGEQVEPSGFLSWSGGAGATTYKVYLGPAGSGCSTLVGTTTSTSMAFSGLTPGEYDWKVVAEKTGCTTPPESACVRFTVANPCPNQAPSLIAPEPNAQVPRETRFEWTTVSDAIQYRLVIYTLGGSGGFEELAVIPQPAAPLPPTVGFDATLPLGTVQWRVLVDYAGGCESVSTRDQIVTVVRDCPSAAPVPITPLENAPVGETPVLFRWSPVSGTVRYELYLAINGAPFQNVGTVPGTAETPSIAVDIPAGASLAWYAEAFFEDGCGSARSRTVNVEVSCFPPVLSLQGEVTTGKPYEVRATIVSVGQEYLFEESDTEAFTTVVASKQGQVDPTGQFVFAMFEHEVTAPRAFFYRVKLAQAGCEFSDVGRIVVIPLPPPTSTDADTVVQFGNEEEVRQPLFIASPTPDRQTSYTYIVTTDRDWMRVEPPGGTIGQSGVTVTVVTNPVGLPVGTNTGTVTLTFIELAGSGKQALETPPITGSKPVSVTLVTPVTNKGKGGPAADSLIIPAVAHATGVNSQWQTDVRILNLSAQKQKYRLFWTSTGTDATLSGKNSDVELAPGQSSALDDIVKQWYGLGSMPGENATGVLEIRPLEAGGAGKGASAVPVTRSLSSLASSRTYNKTPQGTLGEYIPAIPFASFVGGATPAGGEKSVLSLQQLAQSSSHRTNIGVAEASGQPVTLEMRFYDGDGTKLLTVPVSLRAGEHQQFNQILATHGLTNVSNARAEIEVVSGSGRIAAYASVVDNITGDPLQVRAVDLATLGARKYVLPGIAHFDTGQARWRSDVQMFNAGLASVTATVSFFPTGATSAAKTATVEIEPGRMRTLADIVPTLFGSSNTGGAIQIATATNSELVVTGRTYDQREAGSYGQFMAAVTEDEAIGTGDRAVQVLQLEQSSNIRTNLGIVEVTGKPVRVEITAFPAESRVTPRLEFNLQPNEFRQLNEVLKTLNAGTTYNARVGVRVIGGDGKIVAYGSAVDNLTQDPTFIPGQ